MHSRYATVEFLLGIIHFVMPIWTLAAPLFDKDRTFYTEIADRLKEFEAELLKWQDAQFQCKCVVTKSVMDAIENGTPLC